MPNDYCTVDEIKATMVNSGLALTTDYDGALTTLAARASRLIDGLFKFGPGAFYADTDQTRYFMGSGGPCQYIDYLAGAPTSVSVAESGDITDYTTWASTDYMLWPYNAAQLGLPYMRLDVDTLFGSKTVFYRYPKSVKIVGPFGWSATVPDEIKQATITQVARWLKRAEQAFADSGAITELSQLTYVNELDPDIRVIRNMAKFQRVTI